MSGASWFVVSCGVRLAELGSGIIPKPRVTVDSILAPIWCQNTLTLHDSGARTTSEVLTPPRRRNLMPRRMSSIASVRPRIFWCRGWSNRCYYIVRQGAKLAPEDTERGSYVNVLENANHQ